MYYCYRITAATALHTTHHCPARCCCPVCCCPVHCCPTHCCPVCCCPTRCCPARCCCCPARCCPVRCCPPPPPRRCRPAAVLVGCRLWSWLWSVVVVSRCGRSL